MDVPYEVLGFVVLAALIGFGILYIVFLAPEGSLRFVQNIIGIFWRPLAGN